MAISHGRSGGGRASTGMNRAAAGRTPAANLAKRAGPFTSGAKTTQYTPKAAAPKTGPTNLGGYSKPAAKAAPTNQMKANAVKNRTRGR